MTGADGQVGRALRAELPGARFVGRGELDVTDARTVRDALGGADLVVNCAAMTDVDGCEAEPQRAMDVNGTGAANVAAAARRMIQISTDYVFAGGEVRPYREDDPTGPRTVYGRSKLAGETAIAAANPDHAILRTAWLYSPYGSNFVKTMLRLAGDRDTIKVVDDQHGNPTYVPDLAEAILRIAKRMLDAPGDPSLRGVFHVVAPDSATWCDFAREIMALSGLSGGPAATIIPITTAEYPTPAERPRNSRLDCGKAQAAFGVELPRRAGSLHKCLNQILTG